MQLVRIERVTFGMPAQRTACVTTQGIVYTLSSTTCSNATEVQWVVAKLQTTTTN